MMRGLTLLLVFALAACSGPYGAGRAGQGPDTAVARFVPGGEVTVIQVTVSDPQAMRAADLVYGDGEVVAAYSIDAHRAVAYAPAGYQAAAPSGVIGGAGGFGGGNSSFGAGIGITFPVGSWYAPGSQVVYSGQIQSTALIRIPDPERYRRDWQDAKVRIRLGDPPAVNFVTLPAPSPPPGL
ncbi:MAG TPA: hypothetical protein VFA50_06415 [Stellaceae bacterium]|nr:hypothetical protein [Stellaceae bacterium]